MRKKKLTNKALWDRVNVGDVYYELRYIDGIHFIISHTVIAFKDRYARVGMLKRYAILHNEIDGEKGASASQLDYISPDFGSLFDNISLEKKNLEIHLV